MATSNEVNPFCLFWPIGCSLSTNLTEIPFDETFTKPNFAWATEEPMFLAEIVEGKKEALRVAEVAQILDVSIKKIYRMAAKGQIPSLKISSSIRFDPHDIAVWLRNQSNTNSIPAISLPCHGNSGRNNNRYRSSTRLI